MMDKYRSERAKQVQQSQQPKVAKTFAEDEEEKKGGEEVKQPEQAQNLSVGAQGSENVSADAQPQVSSVSMMTQ